MTLDWQIIVVVLAVGWAGFFVARHVIGMIVRPSAGACGHGGCGHCPSNTTSDAGGLIQLQPPKSVTR